MLRRSLPTFACGLALVAAAPAEARATTVVVGSDAAFAGAVAKLRTSGGTVGPATSSAATSDGACSSGGTASTGRSEARAGGIGNVVLAGVARTPDDVVGDPRLDRHGRVGPHDRQGRPGLGDPL